MLMDICCTDECWIYIHIKQKGDINDALGVTKCQSCDSRKGIMQQTRGDKLMKEIKVSKMSYSCLDCSAVQLLVSLLKVTINQVKNLPSISYSAKQKKVISITLLIVPKIYFLLTFELGNFHFLKYLDIVY